MELNFVLCPAYHGATLLALLLNNHPKISSLGDAIPRRTYDQRCACKKLVSQCKFWRKIGKELDMKRFSNSDYLLPMYPLVCRNQTLNKTLNRMLGVLSLYFGTEVWKLLGYAGREYAQIYLKFYNTVCAIQGTEIFVEGAKNLIEPLVLKSFTGEEHPLKVLHLSRDPRGYFNSQKKHHPQTTLKSAAKKWKRYHGAVEKLRRSLLSSNYLFLRYEDLCREPSKWMQQVFDFFQVEYQDVFQAPINPQKHHLMGNKMLFQFDGTIKLDNTWQTRVTEDKQKGLLQLTQPLSSTFGYC